MEVVVVEGSGELENFFVYVLGDRLLSFKVFVKFSDVANGVNLSIGGLEEASEGSYDLLGVCVVLDFMWLIELHW